MLPRLLDCISKDDSVESIKKLIESGLALDIVDDKGWNVLHYAANAGNKELILWCLSQADCPDINLTCHNGKTPLMVACANVNSGASAEVRAEFVKFLCNIPSSQINQVKGSLHFSYQSGLRQSDIDASMIVKSEALSLNNEENSYGYFSIS